MCRVQLELLSIPSFFSYGHMIVLLGLEICTLWFQFFGAVFASKGYPFKNIYGFTTAGDWDSVAAIERLPALHFSVDFIFLSFGIMGFIVEL